DLSAYENSLTPLNTLSTMAGWFFLIVLAIGGIILVVFNIFNLRERKYEIGVLTAIGMKKHKVATQFITELFAVTLIAIVIGTSIGSAISVPVTNSLLANQIESAEASFNAINENFGFSKDTNVNVGSNKMPGSRPGTTSISYIDSISSATNLTVVLQLIAVGILLTIISGLAALISIMRYEPLKILSSRS
ncbi:FtsX-like permease family protein, partial [Clostridium sp.]